MLKYTYFLIITLLSIIPNLGFAEQTSQSSQNSQNSQSTQPPSSSQQSINKQNAPMIPESGLMCHASPSKKFSIVHQHWYNEILFKDPEFNYQFIRTLGYSYSQGADLGECFSTGCNIKESDIASWYTEWLGVANRLKKFAQNQNSSGNFVSAKEANFRASNYFRTASFFMVSPEDRKKGVDAWFESRNTFLEALVSLPNIKEVRIPYENILLPGYFIRSEVPDAPLLIVHSGFDGTAEELYFEVGAAAMARGYNVLLFEGPGQGEVIKVQNVPFRFDWEKVVTPVINFAVNLPGINKNKIALMGISMGGYLAPRACAFEPRIKACIANGGVYDLYEPIDNKFPHDLQTLATSDPTKYNEIIMTEMKTNVTLNWFFNNGMWTFGVDSPVKLMQQMQKYNLKNVAAKIKQPILIVDSEDDQMLRGQAKKLFDAIEGNQKTYYLFTTETAAEAHCQMGAIAISNEVIFDWLDKQFKSND